MKKKYIVLTILALFLCGTLMVLLSKTYADSDVIGENTILTTLKDNYDDLHLDVTFQSGTEDVITSKTVTLTANSINGYITLPSSFKETTSFLSDKIKEQLDDETFVSNDGYTYSFTGWKIKDSGEYLPSKTVFQPGDIISYDDLNVNNNGTLILEAIFGRVTFLQNKYTGRYYTDYWLYDKETTEDGRYEKTGAWNYTYENNLLTINKGIDVHNPLASLDLAYYIFTEEKESLYYNPYLNVVMLTGDYDYVKSSSVAQKENHYFTDYAKYSKTFTKNKETFTALDEAYDSSKNYVWEDYVAQKSVWGGYLLATDATPSATYKSLGHTNYNLYFNGFGYSDAVYTSMRLDNVNWGRMPNDTTKRPLKTSPSNISSETNFISRSRTEKGKGLLLEITRRNKKTDAGNGYVIRTNDFEYAVVNGNEFGSMQNGWSGSYDSPYDFHWYIGGNTIINGYITLGVTTTNATFDMQSNMDYYLTVTGGKIVGIYGASASTRSHDAGNRFINIVGDKGNSTTSNPQVRTIYGAGNVSSLTGNTSVNIIGDTNILENVYGGGYVYSATLYGTSNVNIKDSTIAGSVYGGGFNGNVETDENGKGGYVNLNITSSLVKGNIFGIGQGGSQSFFMEYPKSFSKSTTYNYYPWDTEKLLPTDSDFASLKNSLYADYATDWSWEKPATGFPFMVLDETSSEYGIVCTSAYKGIRWISMNADNITFSRSRNFSYLSLAYARKDVTIQINDSTIGTSSNNLGNIYGGGSIAVVHGDIKIDLNHSTVYGTIYGGGDGASKPSTVKMYGPMKEEGYTPPSYTYKEDGTVSILGVENVGKLPYLGEFSWTSDKTVKEMGGIDYDNKKLWSYNAEGLGSVKGSITLTIQDSTLSKNVYGGGNEGYVNNGITLNVINTTIADTVYGGGNEGEVTGDITVTLKGVTSKEVYAGSYAADVNGSTTLNVLDSKISQSVYGGNNSDGIVSNNITVTLKGTTKVMKDVFGGGNLASVGTSKESNSLVTVNVYGGTISGDVYGGSNVSKVFGATKVNIGGENEQNLSIKGTLFGGGKASSAGTDTYDYSYIAVTNGTTLNIDGEGYETFKIEGSIFGSGNASTTEGESNISIKNYGSENNIQKNISFQRATKIILENSYVELSGTTDRTNEFASEIFTLSRIDTFILKGSSTLYLQNGTNLVKQLESRDDKNNFMRKDNVSNYLYVMQGKNIKITTSQDASSYGSVLGMSFLGLYDKNGEDYIFGLYDKNLTLGQEVSSDISNTFNLGTYVLGAHSSNYEENGFITHVLQDNRLANETINPTPNDQNYHFWRLGSETEVINIGLNASKYETLGKHTKVTLSSANQNTTYFIKSINTENFTGELLNPNELKSYYANQNDANNKMALTMRVSGSEWESEKEYFFTSLNSGTVSSEEAFKTSNVISAPSLEFYLNNAKNISEEASKGTITIRLVAERRISALEIETKDIVFNISVKTMVYDDIDYETNLISGRQAVPFATTSVSISPYSSLSLSVIATGKSLNIYENKTYHRYLTSSVSLPSNTKITMIDLSGSNYVDKTSSKNPKTYYYIVSKSDVQNNTLNYPLSLFREMGTYDTHYLYDDKTSYYTDGYISENFLFYIDFEDVTTPLEVKNDYSLGFLNLLDDNTPLIRPNTSTVQTTLYNIVSPTDNFNFKTITLDKDSYYPKDDLNVHLEIDTKNKMIETSLQDKSLALGAFLLKEENGVYTSVSSSSLMGLEFNLDNKTYTPLASGEGKFFLSSNVTHLAKDLKINLEKAHLEAGNYKIQFNLYVTGKNFINNIVTLSSYSRIFEIMDTSYGLNVEAKKEQRVIDTSKEENHLDFTLTYQSSLKNPNIRVSLKDKQGNLEDITSFVQNDLKSTTETHIFKLFTTPTKTNEGTFIFRDNIKTGAYDFIFALYDEDKYIGETSLNIIIK